MYALFIVAWSLEEYIGENVTDRQKEAPEPSDPDREANGSRREEGAFTCSKAEVIPGSAQSH